MRRALALGCGVLAVLLGAGCGAQEAPKPDDVVVGFFTDAVNGDARAACASLTGSGRAQALGRGSAIGKLPKAIGEDRCARGHLSLEDSTELPEIVRDGLLRVMRVDVHGSRAVVHTKAGEYRGVQHLRRTADGWKIESFDIMVHH